VLMLSGLVLDGKAPETACTCSPHGKPSEMFF